MAEEVDAFLKHYGVLGMHWGRRKGGSGSDATKSSHTHEDAIRAKTAKAVVKKHGTKALSNKELQDLITRTNLETQYSRLNPGKVKKGQDAVGTVLKVASFANTAVSLANSPAAKLVKESLKS